MSGSELTQIVSSGNSEDIMSDAKPVPAWKRLGLKLKNAHDPPEGGNDDEPHYTYSQRQADGDGTLSNKRHSKHTPNDHDGIKKRKTDFANTLKHSRAEQQEDAQFSGVGQGRSYGFGKSQPLMIAATTPKHTKFFHGDGEPDHGPDHSASQKQTRKKSVSFTPETKIEDGYSAHNLFKTWTADQQRDKATSNAQESSDAANPATPTKVTWNPSQTAKREENLGALTSEKKSKQDKKKSREKRQPDSDSAEPTPGYVQYLEQFYSDKSNWKFNKSKQNDILKNVWSIYRIPPAHNAALLTYMSGLQGVAARQRLVQGAEEVLRSIWEKTSADEIKDMGTPEARRQAYYAALRKQIEKFERAGARGSDESKAQLEELRAEVETGKRAEAILRELLVKELYPEHVKAEIKPNGVALKVQTDIHKQGDTTTKAKRKRKSRTTEVSSDEESSGSSASESSSGSDGSVGSSSSEGSDSERHASDSSDDESEQNGKRKAIFDKELLDQVFAKKGRKS